VKLLWTFLVKPLFLLVPVLVVPVLIVPAVQSQVATIARPRENAPGLFRGHRRAHRPRTIWERMQDPRGWWQSRFEKSNLQSESPRLRSFASSVRPFAGEANTNPIFFIPPTYDSGGRFARNIEVGDFNGDGKADLLVSNQCVSDADCTQGIVAVLLGNGDGAYQAASVSNTGAVLASVTTGDFNRDGKLDVAVNNACPDIGCTTGSVNILLGNGDGTFQSPVAYPSGGNAFSVEAGDVNGDGKLDLVVVNGSNSAGVLLGNGDGSFKPVSSFTTSTSGNSAVFLGDFNGDGRPDLAVVSAVCDATTCTRSVSALLGNGDGTFGAPVGNQSTEGLNSQAVALGDVNGDGRLDLAVVDDCVPFTDTCGNEFADVFLGNGDGTFKTAKRSVLNSTDVTFIEFGDLNGDLKPDLVTVVPDSASASVMLGTGDGTFQILNTYETEGTSPLFGTLGDLNGDGKIDLAVANECQVNFQDSCTGDVIALLGNGVGILQGPVGYSVARNSNLESIATADFNGDGRPDLAELTINFNSLSFPSASVNVLLAQPDGTFVAGASTAVGNTSVNSFNTPLVVGDFNRDGKPDLATTACVDQSCATLGLAVLLGRGNGTFNPPLLSTPLPILALAAGDFNGDGKLDLVSATNSCTDANDLICNNGLVNILLGNGDGTFQAPVNHPFVGTKTGSVAVGDFNRDGNLDLVVANNNCGDFDCPMGSLSVLLGNGDGTFQTAVNYSSGDFGAFSVAIGDFNGDGKPDLAVSNLGSCVFLPCGGISSIGVLLGNGDGSFRAAAIFPSSDPLLPGTGDVRSIAVADFDGDGKLDLALSNRNILLGNGDGTFKDAQSYNPGADSGVSEVVADFNGDGKPDLAVSTNQFLIVLLNISSGFQQATSTSLSSSRNPAEVHHHVTFTATVTSTSQAAPTGTITFSDDGHALATVSIANGKARFSTSSLDAGVHSITASYSGDESLLPSTSPELDQVIRADTRTKLTSSHNPSRRGQAVTFTAEVVANSGETPTGKVTFRDFSTVLATVKLSRGQATFTTSRLRKGHHLIRADYCGSSTDERSFAIFAQRVK
jgi:hypothetical protein